jgi:hypothetical protein
VGDGSAGRTSLVYRVGWEAALIGYAIDDMFADENIGELMTPLPPADAAGFRDGLSEQGIKADEPSMYLVPPYGTSSYLHVLTHFDIHASN